MKTLFAIPMAALLAGCAANAYVMETDRFEFHGVRANTDMTVIDRVVVVDKRATEAGEYDIVDVLEYGGAHPGVFLGAAALGSGAYVGGQAVRRPDRTFITQSGGGASAAGGEASAVGLGGDGGSAVSISNATGGSSKASSGATANANAVSSRW